MLLMLQVAPSVQGLDSKLLKGYLKKESCYTNIMTTARIRGVEKVFLVTNHDHYQQSLYRITSDMTVGHLIAEACGADQLSVDLLSKWYLVDESKGIYIFFNDLFHLLEFSVLVTLYLNRNLGVYCFADPLPSI